MKKNDNVIKIIGVVFFVSLIIIVFNFYIGLVLILLSIISFLVSVLYYTNGSDNNVGESILTEKNFNIECFIKKYNDIINEYNSLSKGIMNLAQISGINDNGICLFEFETNIELSIMKTSDMIRIEFTHKIIDLFNEENMAYEFNMLNIYLNIIMRSILAELDDKKISNIISKFSQVYEESYGTNIYNTTINEWDFEFFYRDCIHSNTSYNSLICTERRKQDK